MPEFYAKLLRPVFLLVLPNSMANDNLDFALTCKYLLALGNPNNKPLDYKRVAPLMIQPRFNLASRMKERVVIWKRKTAERGFMVILPHLR